MPSGRRSPTSKPSTPMLAGQRQMLIAEEVRRRGAVRVSELTELFGVSEMTVRRDLDTLAASGLVEKVHGGATAPARATADEPGFEAKSHRQLREKEAIAQAARRLVEPGQAIAVNSGTTTWRLAHYLHDVPDLTVVRNDVYARFSHAKYNKGTALAEIARQLGIDREHVFAAGDHLNDLPMLSAQFARCLVAPDNAVPQVKALVRGQKGYVSHQPWGHGVARGLEFYLQNGALGPSPHA